LAAVSILLPTYERPESLVMTLSGVASQTVADLQVVISSQGRYRAEASPVAQAIARVIGARGGSVEWHHREPRGIAEQRNFLLSCAESDRVLFLDDDIFIEPVVIENPPLRTKDRGLRLRRRLPGRPYVRRRRAS
jgi:glycosyltransferase involved in cell wall biosynthesis